MPSEGGPARFARMAPIDIRPAPVLGQHTRQIAGRLLGLNPAEVADLVVDGVLHEDDAALRLLPDAAPGTDLDRDLTLAGVAVSADR